MIRIEPGSVQETLIIPLYGRKLCAELFPNLYRDESAASICTNLDYGFSELDRQAESTLWQFGALEVAMRQLDMQWEICDYLAAHPHAAVVNMGCGLDQTGRACDNGTCKIYNVDMPDIIEAREQLSPVGDRELNIANNLNDPAWMEEIDGSDGAIFFAAGVFHYFTEAQARTFARELEARFPSGRLVFDTVGKLGKRLMRQTFKNFGMENYDECLFVEDPTELVNWCDAATVSSKGYMLGYYDMDDPAITGFHRFLAHRCDGMVKMRINRFDFSGESRTGNSLTKEGAMSEQSSASQYSAEDYANWMPQGMVKAAAVGTGVLLAADIVVHVATGKNRTPGQKALCTVLTLGTAASAITAGYFHALHRAFDYNGTRQVSKHIIEGIADYVKMPDGGTGLDVGCGSGALTIACAKRNPGAIVVGCDIWTGAYKGTFSQAACENNAHAEDVSNVRFEHGDATKLPFADETFDAVTSNYVYHNIMGSDRQELLLETLRVLKKGGTFALHDLMSTMRYGDMEAFARMLREHGYADAQVIDTTDGLFMTRTEATLLGLGSSKLLVGKK